MSHENCITGCATRRSFLRDIAVAAAGALALTGSTAGRALADSVTEVHPSPVPFGTPTVLYPIPAGDAMQVDIRNEVILARWNNRLYAFSLRCPHRGAKLEWRQSESRVFCPKHEARFMPNGTHDSGRASRDLDRYEILRQGNSIAVSLGRVLRSDQDSEAWSAAVISIG